jgi:hypothetical protein
MRWWRSHLRLGSRLALFALAVQFALSFAHVHLEGFASSPSSISARIAALVDGPQPVALPSDQTAPSKQNRHGQTPDFCAICSVIHLAGTLVPSAAPALPLPETIGAVRFDPRAERQFAGARPAFFQARAPPLS